MKPAREIIGHVWQIVGQRWRGDTPADRAAELQAFRAALIQRYGPLPGEALPQFAAAEAEIRRQR
jgi:ABC-type transporter MlaC component